MLSAPTDFYNVRYFRFGIPLVMKVENGSITTEASALRLLNNSGLDLPIPRLIDSILLDGKTYTIMTRIPGKSLIDEFNSLSDSDLQAIADDIYAFLDRLWTLKQSPADTGKVMLSASGDGVSDPLQFHEGLYGPCPSIFDCYFRFSHFVECEGDGPVGEGPWTEEEFMARYGDAIQAVTSDCVVYVHSDLRPWNIIIKNKRLSGIIDWQNSGWLPRHWQLHSLRNFRPLYPNRIREVWVGMAFPVETEDAFKASFSLLYAPLL